MIEHPHLAQIAFSVTDLARTHDFYHRVLGFEPAGGTEAFRGRLTSAAQGIPDVEATCWWLVDQREYMQLELFQFDSPAVRPLPADWRPCDTGYTSVGLHVTNFDTALECLAAAGVPLLSKVEGRSGRRRVCIRDPEGVLLELMEEDLCAGGSVARPAIPVVARSVTVSVPDLSKARRFWVDTLGLEEAADVTLHVPEHEAQWGLEGARRESLLLWADNFLVELVRYDQPVGRPWPADYRLSDQGLLNVAFGFRDVEALHAAYDRVIAAGYRCNTKPLEIGSGGVVYCNDDQGFSVELLCSSGAAMDEAVGFIPRPEGTLTPANRLGG